MSTYKLCSGEEFDLEKLDKDEQRIIEKWMAIAQNDPTGQGRGYWSEFRVNLVGALNSIHKCKNLSGKQIVKLPVYKILVDILIVAGIRQGYIKPSEK